MPSMSEIITAWLLEHGYDGLFCASCECKIPANDSEFSLFAFCDRKSHYNNSLPHSQCEPGYKVRPDGALSDDEWMIVPDKENYNAKRE